MPNPAPVTDFAPQITLFNERLVALDERLALVKQQRTELALAAANGDAAAISAIESLDTEASARRFERERVLGAI